MHFVVDVDEVADIFSAVAVDLEADEAVVILFGPIVMSKPAKVVGDENADIAEHNMNAIISFIAVCIASCTLIVMWPRESRLPGKLCSYERWNAEARKAR